MNTSERATGVFTEDLIVKKHNMPWFIMSCCIALLCTALFGLFFGAREAMSSHQKERIALTDSFKQVVDEKDDQIKKLIDGIADLQKRHMSSLDRLEESDILIEKFLISEAARLKVSSPEIDALKAHVRRQEDFLKSQRPEKP